MASRSTPPVCCGWSFAVSGGVTFSQARARAASPWCNGKVNDMKRVLDRLISRIVPQAKASAGKCFYGCYYGGGYTGLAHTVYYGGGYSGTECGC